MNKQIDERHYLKKKNLLFNVCFHPCSIFLDVCSIPLLFDYMCMCLSFIPWSIAGVRSSQALPGFLITTPPSACVPDAIGALTCGFQTNKDQK